MATLVLGLAGAAVGSMIPFAAPFGMSWAGIGWTAGNMIGNALFSPDLPDVHGPRLVDKSVQSSSVGSMRTIRYGTNRVAGNILWSTDKIETVHTEEVGGKGGPSQSVTTYTYSTSCFIGLGEGEMVGIRRIWANGNLILDASDTNTGLTGQSDNIIVYTGSETQLPPTEMEVYLGAGNVPGYRGTPGVMFVNFQLEDFGNQVPLFEFEVVDDGSFTTAFPVTLNNDNDYSQLLEHPYRTGVMLGLLNTPVGNDELHVIDYVNSTVKIIDLGRNVGKYMTYVESRDEIWIATNNWFGAGIGPWTLAIALSAQTLAVARTIETPHDNVWGVRYPGKIAYDRGNDIVYFLTGTTTIASGARWYDVQTDTFPSDVMFNAVNCWFSAYNFAMGKSRVAAGEYYGGIYIFGDKQYITTIPTIDSTPGSAESVYYDSFRERFFWYYDTNKIRTIDEQTLTVGEFTCDIPTTSVKSTIGMAYHAAFDKIFLTTDDISTNRYTLYQLNPETFAVENSWQLTDNSNDSVYPVITQCSLAQEYVGLIYVNYSVDTEAQLFPIVPRISTGQISLAEVVADICTRCGLSTSDIDVTQLTDCIDGYTIGQQMSGRSAIEALMPIYYFDAVESDGEDGIPTCGAPPPQ